MLIILELDVVFVYCYLMYLELFDNEIFLLEIECGVKCMVFDFGGIEKFKLWYKCYNVCFWIFNIKFIGNNFLNVFNY